MATMQVFLSHSSADREVAERVVTALRGAGADVWFDEHNLGPGQLLKEITRQLRARPVFIVLLSKRAIASEWVQNECEWAFTLRMSDPSRIILPVVVAPLPPTAMDELLYLSGFKRVEGPNHTPYPEAEMIVRMLGLLALTPAGQAPAPVAPQPSESVDDLLTQGRALAAQKRWAEALPFFQRATEREPRNATAWGELGRMLGELKRYEEALAAYDRALALNDRLASVWSNKGVALNGLKRYEEALAAYDRALALDPTFAAAWSNKGGGLSDLKRYEEALAACDRALALDSNNATAWSNKGAALTGLKRAEEALAAYDRALALDPTFAAAWSNKAAALHNLGRFQEAVAAREQQLRLDPQDVQGWSYKGGTLRALGRIAEAEAAERRARELGG